MEIDGSLKSFFIENNEDEFIETDNNNNEKIRMFSY